MKHFGALLLATAATGCALSTPGELGKLDFRILVDDAPGGSSAILPIAPNTEVTLRVTRLGAAALVTDFRVDELMGAGRRAVLAIGVPPPVRVIPEGAATIAPPGPREGTLLHVTFDRAGVVSLQGDLEEPLKIHVLADDELDMLELENVVTSKGMLLGLHGVVAGAHATIVSTGAELEIDTPDVCVDAEKEAAMTSRSIIGDGMILLSAVSAGRCAGRVTFAGKSATFSQEMAPTAEAPAQR